MPSGVTVTCSYSRVNGLVYVDATVKSQISGFFNIEIAGFTNPSSTAETDSFKLYTFNTVNLKLDEQLEGIILQATRGTL